LGCLLLEELESEFPGILRCDFTIYPSKIVSDIVVEPYNALCSMPHLIENCDMNFVVDNEAIYNISNNVLKAGSSNAQLNHIITSAMLGVTSSLRFSGWLNCDCRKLATNLVPFPRLHYFLITESPLVPEGSKQYDNAGNLREIVEQMISPQNYFAQIDAKEGKYLTVASLFRGDAATNDLEHEIQRLQMEMEPQFVNWIPDHFKMSHVHVPSPNAQLSATFLGNHTGIRSLFQRIHKQFLTLFRRKAFLHNYKMNGMDDQLFLEAESCVKELIQEYQDKNDVVVEVEKENKSLSTTKQFENSNGNEMFNVD